MCGHGYWALKPFYIDIVCIGYHATNACYNFTLCKSNTFDPPPPSLLQKELSNLLCNHIVLPVMHTNEAPVAKPIAYWTSMPQTRFHDF